LVVVKKRKKGGREESDEALIARFKKLVIRHKLIPEYREHERYRKKSEERAEKKKRIKYQIEMQKQED